MIVLVTGASASGKSAIAEKMAVKLRENDLYYLATMHAYGAEGAARVEKHRAMREGKGFQTLEQYTNIDAVSVSKHCVCLLECLSNLVANEMYDLGGAGMDCEKEICADIQSLAQKCKHLVIVTNEVFSDGVEYDVSCMQYLACLGQINRTIAEYADVVIEAVVGIPIFLKGAFDL